MRTLSSGDSLVLLTPLGDLFSKWLHQILSLCKICREEINWDVAYMLVRA